MEDYGSEDGMVANHVRICKLLEIENPVIFDIGANHGLIAANYAVSLGVGGGIHLFEPNPYLIPDIKDNLESSGYRGEIIINQMIVGAKAGEQSLNIARDDGTSSVLDVEEKLLQRNPNGYSTNEVINVEMTTLDLYCENNILIDILKTDTQGYDLQVLQGAEKLLSKNKISIIGIELYFAKAYVGQGKVHQIMSYLDSFGYHLLNFDRLSHTDKGFLYFGDATFVSLDIWNELGCY
jgi:FkbM family methyltransferase